MTEDIKFVLDDASEHMDKTIGHFKDELVKIRAGKAHPSMVDGITVEYYGTPTPLNQVSTISTMDARTLSIQPWEKSMIQPIEKAILVANLGITPQNNGEAIMLPIPRLTEERRKQLVKATKNEGERAKIALRSIRHTAIDMLKELQKEGTSEDLVKNAIEKVQEIINAHGKQVDDILKLKEDEIMTV